MASQTAKSNEHNRRVGALLGNLQALEYLLRIYLYSKAAEPHQPLPSGLSLNSLQVGDIVAENALTDYSSLRNLIKRYNRLVDKDHPELAVDVSLVEVRDALAHGRISAPTASGELRLVKFAKPADGTTKVVFSEQLSPEWLKRQIGRALTEVHKVTRALWPSAEFTPATD